MSLKTYQQTQTAVETPRQTEYRIMARVTRGLVEARDSGVRDASFNEALDRNRRLWTVLSTDCVVKGNGLPDKLRAGIISLSIWVSKHTSQVMRGKDDDVDALIEINRTIMEGLATSSNQTPGEPGESPPGPNGGGIIADA